MTLRPNILSVVALLWIAMIAALLLSDASSQPVSAMQSSAAEVFQTQPAASNPNRAAGSDQPDLSSVPVVEAIPVTPTPAPLPELDPDDPQLVIAPYTTYIVTQGMHGFSYGHAAVDLAAGKGAEILSPINGAVTQLFTDYLGNPTLVIENDVYQVLLMHGDYTVAVGQQLHAGDLVGYESNNGNTIDWAGRSCRGRNCGYHSHLNIFDKRTGENTNPLSLISPSQ